MNAGSGRAQLDTQSLTDVDTYVYETIATLEYTGRPATRSQIAGVTDLDDESLDESLTTLGQHGLIVEVEGANREPAFEPAERGWSAAPERARGM